MWLPDILTSKSSGTSSRAEAWLWLATRMASPVYTPSSASTWTSTRDSANASHGSFLLGEYELAAFAAMKEVEVAVREAAQAPDSEIGVNLMKKAFAQGEPLRNESLIPATETRRWPSTGDRSVCSRTRAAISQWSSTTRRDQRQFATCAGTTL